MCFERHDDLLHLPPCATGVSPVLDGREQRRVTSGGDPHIISYDALGIIPLYPADSASRFIREVEMKK